MIDGNASNPQERSQVEELVANGLSRTEEVLCVEGELCSPRGDEVNERCEEVYKYEESEQSELNILFPELWSSPH